MTEIVKRNEQMDLAIEQVVVDGNLGGLTPSQRVAYYRKVCESLGLNPFTKPFDYITLNGKLTLYARKDATEQLRKLNGVSITNLDGRVIDDLYIVTATAQAKDGRLDQATGAVSVGTLKGEAKANAIMKAETKAKRRVTLSICGLGWTDESEVDSIPGAQFVRVDNETGEIIEQPRAVTPPAQHRPARPPVVVEQQPVTTDDNPFEDEEDLHDEIPPKVAAWLKTKSPVDEAKAWAIEVKACNHPNHASNALRDVINNQFGGRLHTGNLAQVLTSFYLNRQEKLAEAA